MILICSKLPISTIGGVEKVVQQYSNALSHQEQIVLLTYSSEKKLRIKKFGRKLAIEAPYLFRLGSYSFSFSYFYFLLRLSRRARIINTHVPFPLVAEFISLFLFKKCIMTWHADIPKNTLLSSILNISHSLAMHRMSKVIFTSDFYKKKYDRIQYKSEVVSLWLDECDPEDNSCFSVPSKFILFLGRFGRYKGLDVLSEALKDPRLDIISFIIVGEGPFLPQELEARENVIVKQHFVSDSVKNFLFKNCHLFVLPSTDEGEAFGITQLEALREGKPVINTNLDSGVPYVSKHMISGLTVKVGDPKALVEAILLLWENDEIYKTLQSGAKLRYAQLFNKDNSIKKLEHIFGDENGR